MSYLDNMLEKFDAGSCIVGYFDTGTIVVDGYVPTQGDFFPFANAIEEIANPSNFALMFRKAVDGDKTSIGFYEGVNVAGLTITASGVRADLELPNDEYSDELTFAEFAPILAAWEKAWAAAKKYRSTLPKR